MAKLYMERQAKSREKPGLGTKNKETKMHITQNLLVGFLPNLHQQTRRVCIFLYMKSLLCRRQTMCHCSIPSLHSQSLLDYKTATR